MRKEFRSLISLEEAKSIVFEPPPPTATERSFPWKELRAAFWPRRSSPLWMSRVSIAPPWTAMLFGPRILSQPERTGPSPSGWQAPFPWAGFPIFGSPGRGGRGLHRLHDARRSRCSGHDRIHPGQRRPGLCSAGRSTVARMCRRREATSLLAKLCSFPAQG